LICFVVVLFFGLKGYKVAVSRDAMVQTQIV